MTHRFLFLLSILIAIPGVVTAQDLTIWSAYARSNFDWPSHSQAGAIPVGVRMTVGGSMLQLGIEASANDLVPYTYQRRSASGAGDFDKSVVLRTALAVLLVDPAPHARTSVVGRLGYGVYHGFSRIRPVDAGPVQRSDGASRYGASAGGGVRVGRIQVEAVYHLLDWEPAEGAGLYSSNSLEIRFGVALIQ